jgi:hypothetical protein
MAYYNDDHTIVVRATANIHHDPPPTMIRDAELKAYTAPR